MNFVRLPCVALGCFVNISTCAFSHFCNKLSSDLLRNAGFVLKSATAKTCPKRTFQTRHPSEKTIRDIRPVPINRHAAEAK